MIGAGLIGRSLHLWLQTSAWREQWNRMLHSAFGPVALGLMALGLLWPLRNPRHYLFHIWLLASVLFLLLIPEAILGWNDYYLLLLVPPSAGLIGIGLGKLYERRATRTVSLVLSVALAISSVLVVRQLFRSDGLHYHLGVLLRDLVPPNGLIATAAGGAPDPLYFSERRGWEANKYELSRLEQLSTAGAKLFIMADPDAVKNNIALVPLLDRRFLRLTQESAQTDWMIWSLDPIDLDHATSNTTETEVVYPTFGAKITLKGASAREVLPWPASFEVVYEWRCLSKINVNLRLFVHVTKPDGQTVFQQDHWPMAGHVSTAQWNVGAVIRERCVLVLPGDLTPGRYQLRVGWFDPVRGPRLSVAGAGSDGEDRAIVSELSVKGRPPSGWFRAGQ